jgi:hypothetical protein
LSDYDIAVFVDPKNEPILPYGIKSHITGLFANKIQTQKVQIVILNEANPFLAFEAVNKGRLVFKKEPSLETLRSKASFGGARDSSGMTLIIHRTSKMNSPSTGSGHASSP